MGQTVVLECLGNIEGSRFLDGRTGGRAGLAPSNISSYSGTFWDLEKLSDGTYSFKCLGASIPRDGAAYLDGRTGDGSVGLASNTNPPYTGTHWQLNQDSDGFFTIVCQGNVPGNRYLDGRTHDGSVGLAPNTDPPFTGTRWAIYTKLSL